MFRKIFLVHNRTSLFLELSFQRAKTGRAGPKLLTGRAGPGRKFSARYDP